MTIRFAIVDDQPHEVRHIRSLIGACDVGSKVVWPADSRSFTDWRRAWEAIVGLEKEGWNPASECCVLVLDVALGNDTDHIKEGIEEISRQLNSEVFSQYVVIIVSHFEGEMRKRLVEQVDHIVDKAMLYSPQRNLFFQDAVSSALSRWSVRTKRQNPIAFQPAAFRRVDGVAMRRLEASVGPEAIDRLGAAVAGDWKAASVEALNGGYSGAFLLSFSEESGSRRIVCKASRTPSLIREEVDRTYKALTYDFYASHMTPQTELCQLPIEPKVAYITLASIAGRTLEAEILHAVASGPQAGPRCETVVGELVEIAVRASNVRIDGERQFTELTQEDVNRFDSSIEYLLRLRQACVDRGILGDAAWNSPDHIRSFHVDVVHKWNNHRSGWSSIMPASCPQHGDLNPRNVLVGTGGHLSLIDFARFGGWPPGYDLVRLELQLFLRILSRMHEGESFPDDVKDWWSLWHAYCVAEDNFSFVSSRGDVQMMVRLLSIIQSARHRILAQYDKVTGRTMTYLLRCLDAIKMCSYQDATSFKRLLFLFIAVDCAQKSGLFSAKL